MYGFLITRDQVTSLPVGTNYCLCRGCGTRFKSVYAFDIHRVGVSGDRRCMAEGEMRERGLAPNEKGYWRKPRN